MYLENHPFLTPEPARSPHLIQTYILPWECYIGNPQIHMQQSAVTWEASADNSRTICRHLTKITWNHWEESENLKCHNHSQCLTPFPCECYENESRLFLSVNINGNLRITGLLCDYNWCCGNRWCSVWLVSMVSYSQPAILFHFWSWNGETTLWLQLTSWEILDIFLFAQVRMKHDTESYIFPQITARVICKWPCSCLHTSTRTISGFRMDN